MLQRMEMDQRVPLADQLAEEVGLVTLINTFTAAPEDADALLEAWAADAAYLKTKPGFISTQLPFIIGDLGQAYRLPGHRGRPIQPPQRLGDRRAVAFQHRGGGSPRPGLDRHQVAKEAEPPEAVRTYRRRGATSGVGRAARRDRAAAIWSPLRRAGVVTVRPEGMADRCWGRTSGGAKASWRHPLRRCALRGEFPLWPSSTQSGNGDELP
jgi:hypothetical protein